MIQVEIYNVGTGDVPNALPGSPRKEEQLAWVKVWQGTGANAGELVATLTHDLRVSLYAPGGVMPLDLIDAAVASLWRAIGVRVSR